MSTPSIQAWLIDLDGTLYSPRPVQLAMALELVLTGPHRVPLLREFRKQHEKLREEFHANPELECAPSPFEEQLRRSAESLRVDQDRLRALVQSWMMERPAKWLRWSKRRALLDEIARFKQSGGKTALVSDYPAEIKLRALGVRELFDIVVSNGEHQRLTRLKPSPDGYRIAASELDVPPENCLVIGDRADADGLAAARAGMQFRLVR